MAPSRRYDTRPLKRNQNLFSRHYFLLSLPTSPSITAPPPSLLSLTLSPSPNPLPQVEPKPSSTLGHILYVFHRDALGGTLSLSVRHASLNDYSTVASLVAPVQTSSLILQTFKEALSPWTEEANAEADADGVSRHVALVAECSGQLVSLALLDRECEVGTLASQYALEDFILFSEHRREGHAMLRAFVVNPIFARYSRFVLREVFRLQQISCVYFKLLPHSTIPSVLHEFVQVGEGGCCGELCAGCRGKREGELFR